MKKTVVIGDIHGKSIWKQIVDQENPDRVVFVGDYFDSFDIKGEEQLNNFLDIMQYKKDSKDVEVVCLIGNHCHHYFPEIGDTGTSGYQRVGKYQIEPIIDANREHLQMAYSFDGFLFTHAGVSPVFMDEVYGVDGWSKETIADDLNELFKYKPKAFEFNGFDPYGDDECQTPIWIRPKSLMISNRNHKNGLRKDYIQIVGHTKVKQIDIAGKATGGRYYFIDCLDTSKEYLVIQDNKLSVGQIN